MRSKLAIPMVVMADPPRIATAIKDKKLILAKLCRETAGPRVRLPIEEIVLSYRKKKQQEGKCTTDSGGCSHREAASDRAR